MQGYGSTATDPATLAESISLVVGGRVEPGARLIGDELGPPIASADADRLLEGLGRSGARLVYAVPSARWPVELLEGLGFSAPFEVAARNFNLGLSGISSRLDERLQRLARFARRIRQKLIEVELDQFVSSAARLFAERRSEIGFAVERDEAYLRGRYGAPSDRGYRRLVLRRQAGVGIDAFAVIRSDPDASGPRSIQLIDHWTRVGERRSTTWLLGELAMWGLVENVSRIETFAASGSVLDHLFIAAGAIKKTWSTPFFVRSLAAGEEAPLLSPDQVQLRAGDLEIF